MKQDMQAFVNKQINEYVDEYLISQHEFTARVEHEHMRVVYSNHTDSKYIMDYQNRIVWCSYRDYVVACYDIDVCSIVDFSLREYGYDMDCKRCINQFQGFIANELCYRVDMGLTYNDLEV